MGVGVFGKLPAKRDFVQKDMPRELMEVLDPWLQSALGESQSALGDGWLDHYLSAPIWRFWLGSAVIGRSVLGALMPSVDWIGRYFPLCVAGTWDDPVGPPEINLQTAWYAGVEALMLEQLMSENATYEELLDGLKGVAPPEAEPSEGFGNDLAGQLARLRHASAETFYRRQSYWWVPENEDTSQPAMVRMHSGMPSPVEYTAMIAIDRIAEPSAAAGGM